MVVVDWAQRAGAHSAGGAAVGARSRNLAHQARPNTQVPVKALNS